MGTVNFAKRFAERGGRWAFGVPGGGSSLALITELARHEVRFITTGHEATAGLMAAACARYHSAPALAITIKGPGLMNLAPALLSSSYEGFPCLSLSEAYGPDDRSGRRHKWLDHRSLLGGFVRASGSWRDDAACFDNAWARATAEFPGPVHLDLADGHAIATTTSPPARRADFPWWENVRAAQRPILIVGSLAIRSPWRAQLAKLGCPVFTTAAAKGALAENLPQAAGVYTGEGKALAPETALLPQADLVITLGVRSEEILSPRLPHARTLAVDTDALPPDAMFPRNDFGALLVPLPGNKIAELLDMLTDKPWGAELVAACLTEMRSALGAFGWSPFTAMSAAQRALPDAVHAVDTGNFTIIAEHTLTARHELDVLGTPNGRFLGVGLGYALGACLNPQRRPVLLWIGDGGLRSYFGELALALEHRLDLLVLVMKDGFYGSIRARARQAQWAEAPLVMRDRRFRAQADALGMFTAAAQSEEELAEALTQWRRAGVAGLVECAFDPTAYLNIVQPLR